VLVKVRPEHQRRSGSRYAVAADVAYRLVASGSGRTLGEGSGRSVNEHLIDLTQYSFSLGAIFRRFGATSGMTSRSLNMLGSFDGRFWQAEILQGDPRAADTGRQFAPYFEQETAEIPAFYTDLARKDLGLLWTGFRIRYEP
jgi:hypothetical protein